jgi:hypothetical protein
MNHSQVWCKHFQSKPQKLALPLMRKVFSPMSDIYFSISNFSFARGFVKMSATYKFESVIVSKSILTFQKELSSKHHSPPSRHHTSLPLFSWSTPSTWHLTHSSMELVTFKFTHVEWLHACTFLEGASHVDTWHLTWFDAYFWRYVPFMSIIWCMLQLFLDGGKLP